MIIMNNQSIYKHVFGNDRMIEPAQIRNVRIAAAAN